MMPKTRIPGISGVLAKGLPHTGYVIKKLIGVFALGLPMTGESGWNPFNYFLKLSDPCSKIRGEQ
jgi:hypothetical protein